MPTTQTQNTTTPTLRFPWFSDWWEEKKLGEISKIYDWTHSTPNYVEKWIPFYSVEHVTANQFKNTRYISESVFNKENERVKLEKWDILMTRIWDIWTSRLIDWNVKASFYVSLALIKQNNKFNSWFLNQYIKSNFLQKELWSRTIHVAFPKKINLWEIWKCSLSLPSLPEQEKIASFLTTVDEKIEKIREKKGLLEEYKKGLMQRLFYPPLKGDTGGSKKDYLRFPGFSDEWEEKKLGDLVNIRNNQRKPITSNLRNNWKYPYYWATWIIDYVDWYIFDEKLLLVWEDWAKRWKNEESAFIAEGQYWVNNHAHVLETKENYDIFFLMTLLNYINLKKYSTWNAPAKLTLDNLKKLKINLPSLSEQEKIANFLSTIDEKIEKIDSELVEVESWKKGLLQRLFV